MVRKPGLNLFDKECFHLPVCCRNQVFPGFEHQIVRGEASLFFKADIACLNYNLFQKGLHGDLVTVFINFNQLWNIRNDLKKQIPQRHLNRVN
jgi:hypothetical protein